MNHCEEVLAYTRRGETELDAAMHLALWQEGQWQSLHNGTGILFPQAELEHGPLAGMTMVMAEPWLFRTEEGRFGVAAVRRPAGAGADLRKSHQVLLFTSDDLTAYTELPLVDAVAQGLTARAPRCLWLPGEGVYELTCRSEDGRLWRTCSEDLTAFPPPVPVQESSRPSPAAWKSVPEDWIPCSSLCLSRQEARLLRDRLDPVYHVETLPVSRHVRKGETPALPERVELRYSDGSTAWMPVTWENVPETFASGETVLTGRVVQTTRPFPFLPDRADPMICRVGQRYYFMATDDENGQKTLKIRGADSVDALASAPERIIYTANDTGEMSGCIWAPELHEIEGRLYVFFAAGNPYWYTVQSYVLPCVGGDPLEADSWDAPVRVRRPDGDLLTEEGITLDMTAFTVEDRTYVVWAQRKIVSETETGTSDLWIAETDPQAPWQLISDPVCICRPRYGWDRIDTTVDEGPFLLRRGDDLFLTFSGASVSVLYCVGLLHARAGDDLLNSESWQETGYPILTSESVEGQFGPGHNAYTVDQDGSDLLVFHAKTPPEPGLDAGMTNRHTGVRRVHWDAAGYPRLDMTPERELNPALSQATLTVIVE